jgi:hypothetical protein
MGLLLSVQIDVFPNINLGALTPFKEGGKSPRIRVKPGMTKKDVIAGVTHREAGWHAINLGTGRGMRSKRLLSLLRLGLSVSG